MTHLTTHVPWLKKIVLAIHFITHGSGAVALIRFAVLAPLKSWADAGAALVDGRLLGRPRAYSGNSEEWNAFKFVFKSYIGVVAPQTVTEMDRAETQAGPITVGGLSQEDAQLTRSLSFLLAQVFSGPPLQLMMNVGDQNELEAWKLLVRAEQPVSGANMIAAMQSILQYKLEEELRTFGVW